MKRIVGMVVACLVSFSPTVARADDTDDSLEMSAFQANKMKGIEQNGKVLQYALYSRKDRAFVMKWTLLGVSDEAIPAIRKARLQVETMRLIEAWCSEPTFRKYINSGAMLGHVYQTQSGANIMAIGVTLEECKLYDALLEMDPTQK